MNNKKFKSSDGDRISDSLWMEHFARALLSEGVIDEKQHRKLLTMIYAEIDRRYGKEK